MNILFISHDASRTGAPYCLLHLVRWLKSNSTFSFRILLRNPGPLQPEFERLAPVLNFRHPASFKALAGTHGRLHAILPWVGALARSGRARMKEPKSVGVSELYHRIAQFNPDLIYSNTVVNGDLLRILSPLGCPVISHVHELRNIIELFGGDNWRSVQECSDRFIAASPAVKSNLVANYGVHPDGIDVVYESVPTSQCVVSPDGSARLRAALGVAEDEFVVVGSGLDEWRKGTDLFINCARTVTRMTAAPVTFVWVGGWLSERARLEHLALAERMGVAERVRFPGMVDNPLDYFAVANVFALTSREDPFPLVCLEAAALGKPVVCFAEAGGMPDFVEEDAGFVVPREDVKAMAERIVELIQDPGLALVLGQRAQAKVRERHDVEVCAPQILRIIERQLGRSGL